MKFLLRLARGIDWLNEQIGRVVLWLILVAVLISAGNAIIRKAFDTSSNAWLEVQWYLFSAVFLLCAGYTLLRNEHVRIDVILHRLPKRTQIWVDIFGLLFFLLPAAILIACLAWPVFVRAFVSGEMSENAGGLIRWPVYILAPTGFALLALQGISELIKRFAFLQGLIEDPTRKKQRRSAEEELAEEIRKQAERDQAKKQATAGGGGRS
ncbi:MAG TPA: TRAP transporter small permease subunit [Burkholderiaceae bacterium]|nr:TRAP transporter small permease subunit [Burkholderiaceae bacterium]